MRGAQIGVFDSGVGGLTVARAIMDLLPSESIYYVGDTANSPYGDKPIARVRELAMAIMDHMVISGVKAIVIACNSATAATLSDARERYGVDADVPIVEVIHPAARRAVAATRNGKVGVIGTHATISSGAYSDAFTAAPDLQLTMQACPRFVELVERGITTGPEVVSVAREYLEPVKAAGVDTLVLGCTHYPLLAGAISYVMGDEVTLVSSADETARDLYRTLTAHDLHADFSHVPQHTFRATGDPESFAALAHRFLPEVRSVTKLEGR
ncbi:MAG: glutamate racemase [Ruaniaceae bacterium]|nr:glutamate racemase [Ruaniaceae bacterium]